MIYLITFWIFLFIFNAISDGIFGWIGLSKRLEKQIESYEANKIKNYNIDSKINDEIILFKENLKLDGIDGCNSYTKKITKFVGLLEISIFSISTIIFFRQESYIPGIEFLVKLVGGWLAIKVIGNYKQWEGSFLGRAIFYNFILGTFINIILGILMGICSLYIAKYIYCIYLF